MKNKKQSETEVQKSSSGVFMKLFLIAMPLFILAVIIVFVLHIAGFNTLDWLKEQGKSIPVVGEMFIDDEEKNAGNDIQALQNQLESKDKIIDNKDEQIQGLEDTVTELESQINSLQDELEETASADAEENADGEQEVEHPQRQANASEKSSMTKTLEGMKSKEAAAILENLEDDLAVDILEEMSTGDRGDILQKMELEAATTYTKMLIELDVAVP